MDAENVNTVMTSEEFGDTFHSWWEVEALPDLVHMPYQRVMELKSLMATAWKRGAHKGFEILKKSDKMEGEG